MKKKSKFPNLLMHFRSIQDAILLPFLLIIVLALAIFLVISLTYTENTVLRNSQDYTMQLVKQVNSDLDSYINYMQALSNTVVGNADVSEFLFGEENKQSELREKLSQQFKTVMDTRSDICNIGVMADNGRMFLNRGAAKLNPYVDIQAKEWYRDTVKARGYSTISSSHVQNILEGSYQWVVTVSKALLNPHTQKVEGLFFVDLNYSSISKQCENISLGDRGYLYILDKDGRYIYHPQQQLIYGGLKTELSKEVIDMQKGSFITGEGENRKLYTVSTSSNTGWTVVGVAYLDDLMKGSAEATSLYGITALALSTMAILFSMLISREITRPIRELEKAMVHVQKGHFDNAEFSVNGKNEIANLGQSFNIMTGRIQNLMEENIQEQKEKRKNELRALQSQINPHFLYNTLDSIIWMAEGGKKDEVVLMTSSLAKLLRQSISNEKEFVTIAQEIAYTQSYLTIQKMRYRDQLEYMVDVDQEIMQAEIVKLVIQPLVENAIYHGIKYLEHKGMIAVMGGRVGDEIHLIVQDNGVGMERDVLCHILEPKAPGVKSNRVGVYNVHHRLQLHYGPGYGLRYESTPGIGTTVYVIIPAEEGMHHGEA